MDRERHRMRKSEIRHQHGGRIGCLENWRDHLEEAHSEKGLMEEPLGREFSQKSREVTSGKNKDLVSRGRQTVPRPGALIQLMDISRNPGDTRLGAKTEGGVLIRNQPDLGGARKKERFIPISPQSRPRCAPEGTTSRKGLQGSAEETGRAVRAGKAAGSPRKDQCHTCLHTNEMSGDSQCPWGEGAMPSDNGQVQESTCLNVTLLTF